MKTRNPTLDLIRVVSGLLVCGVHFFLYTGFYSEELTDGSMYLPIFVRTFMGMCVPMFVMLTGYLMNEKKLTKRYYLGIVKILVTYVLASVAGVLYNNLYLKSGWSVKEAILKIFDFSAAQYGWYIEMYIGLFLLIPFLNLSYHGLNSRKKKLVLIVSLCLLTALPSFFNTFNFTISGWWANPSVSNEYQALAPDYWVIIYPITYYFIGAYIKEYPPKLSKTKLFVILMIIINLLTVYNYYRCWHASYRTNIMTNWQSFQFVITTPFFFSLLSKIKLDNAPTAVKKVLAKLSDITLGTYLLSYIFDRTIYYDYFGKWVPTFLEKFAYYPLLMLIIYILSAVSAFILSLISSPLTRFILFVIRKIGELISKIKNRKSGSDTQDVKAEEPVPAE